MRDVVVGLFDDSANLLQPWIDAGYECHLFDILNDDTVQGKLYHHYADLTKPLTLPAELAGRVAFVSCHPPCDHLAISGARWFAGKGLRKLADSVHMFATAAEVCEATGAKYMIENPVSTISTYWRACDYTYHPYEYAREHLEDNYTKKTCLWTGGGFVMPPTNMHPSVQEVVEYVKELTKGRVVSYKTAVRLSNNDPHVKQFYPDDRIHQCAPGEHRAYLRSVTPESFGIAVFNANKGAADA